MTEENGADGIDAVDPLVGLKVLLADDNGLYRDPIIQALRRAHQNVTVFEA